MGSPGGQMTRGRRWGGYLPVVMLACTLAVSAGCGDSRDRAVLKQADQILKGGNPKAAANQVKGVLQRSPRNVLALRMLRKVKGHLLKKADAEMRAQNYKGALDMLQVLLELEPDHKKGVALQAEAKKHRAVADARAAQGKGELGTAIEQITAALLLDPNFAEATELQETLMEQRDDEVKRLLALAPTIIQAEPATVVRNMQQVVKMDNGNERAQEYLREAQVMVLAEEKRANLEAARAFYQEQRYEAAVEKAEAILAVDPSSYEAKSILERAKAESTRPELRLTGISVIRGLPTVAVEIRALGQRKILREGDEIGPYRVSEIDVSTKVVQVEFIPTGSLLNYTTARE